MALENDTAARTYNEQVAWVRAHTHLDGQL